MHMLDLGQTSNGDWYDSSLDRPVLMLIPRKQGESDLDMSQRHLEALDEIAGDEHQQVVVLVPRKIMDGVYDHTNPTAAGMGTKGMIRHVIQEGLIPG